MMKKKNDVEVLIGGEKYTLCGYESSDYLQKVATYINVKIDEVAKNFGSLRVNNDTRVVLTEINIADDYFKAMERLEEMTKEKEEADRVIFELKHELVAAQEKIDKLTSGNKKRF